MTITWRSNDMFRYMLKAEFVTLVSFKSPVGQEGSGEFSVFVALGQWNLEMLMCDDV